MKRPRLFWVLFVALAIQPLALCAEQVKVHASGPKSVKLTLVQSPAGQIFASVVVNERTLKMLVDTGSPHCSIDAEIAATLGIKGDPGTRQKVAMGGSVVVDELAYIDLSAGALKVHGCPIHLVEMSDLRSALRAAGREDFDGFIGMDMLTFFRAEIDIGKGLLLLRRP